MAGRTVSILLLAVIIVNAGAIYLPILGFSPSIDDFNLLTHVLGLRASDWHGLLVRGWTVRPLQTMIVYLNVILRGPLDLLIAHLFSYVCYLISIYVLYLVSRRFFMLERGASLLAALIYSLHPANIQSVFQIDTISQLLSVLFFLLMLLSMSSPDGPDRSSYVLFAGLAVLSILSKETSLGLLLGAPAAFYLLRWKKIAGCRRRVIELFVIVIAVIGIYVIARYYLVGTVATGVGDSHRYSVSGLGTWWRNVALLSGGTFYYGNTLDIFVSRSILGVFIAASISGAVLWLTVSMLMGGGSREIVIVLAAALLILAGMIPVVLASNVSELYTYSCTPFYSIIAAGSMVFASRRTGGGREGRWRLKRTLVIVFMVLFIVQGEYSLFNKMKTAREYDSINYYYITLTDAFIVSDATDLCISEDEIMNRSRAYSTMIQPDAEILRRYTSFIERTRGISFDVAENGSAECRIRVTKR
jgi:hypothetical protein